MASSSNLHQQQDPLIVVIDQKQDPFVSAIDQQQNPLHSPIDENQDPFVTCIDQPDDSFVTHINNIFSSPEFDAPICVFKVPNSVSVSNPDAYSPQVVGLGPFHHHRSDLGSMQMYKLTIAKRILKGFRSCIEFQELIHELARLMPSIRACYQIYLSLSDCRIACIMAIDSLFLFGLLCRHGIAQDVRNSSYSLRGLIDPGGTRLAQDGILRDMMMLENQIPMLVLKGSLSILLGKSSDPKHKDLPLIDIYLPRMLLAYCKALSPFDLPKDYSDSKALECLHLLDLLYDLIITPQKTSKEGAPEDKEKSESKARVMSPSSLCSRLMSPSFGRPRFMPKEEEEEEKKEEEEAEGGAESMATVTRIAAEGLNAAANLPIPPPVKKPIELVKGLSELPWSKLGLPSIWKVYVPAEVLVPTASDLCEVGVKFLSTEHITAIGFDPITRTFKLPVIKLNNIAEVVIRNLVAYEAMHKPESEPLIFARYVDLMNGIIETAEDVKVLKDQGILKCDKSIKDDKVVKIFTGMGKPVRVANAPELDKVIKDVNSHYNAIGKVKAHKFIKQWGLNVWHFRTLVAVILLLLLTALQTFCSVYDCNRLFHTSS
ncbi:hypothetical protein CJ030_MR3G007320 [Morella rubra]|uniref:Uncharacterized protein n=1 Tax=Morella rubra TaxID=262757 RepID=A0A6A1W0V0_9ROSI|nr:hypothetical protein CJ030_MR3G007320 [Morella rubra]